MPHSTTLAESWILGVAANPAAPSDVLLRLLNQAGAVGWKSLCEERALPTELVAAVLAHPDRRVRGMFARNPLADPADRALLVDDPEPMVRYQLAAGPRRHHRVPPKPLPDAVLETLLLRDGVHGNELLRGDEFRDELFRSRQVPDEFLRGLLHHENPALRMHAARIWSSLSDDERQALLTDPDPGVREETQRTTWWDVEMTRADIPEQDCHARLDRLANCPVSRDVVEDCFASRRNLSTLAGNRHTPPDVLARLARDPDHDVRARVANRADLDPAVVAALAIDSDAKVRELIAGYPDLDPTLLADLARDPDKAVRARALLHPRTTTVAQRRRVSLVAHPADAIGHVEGTSDGLDADWLAACAMSADVRMRRIAAIGSKELPADHVNGLFHDPDLQVRHLLAYNHPAAPAELLLEAFIAGPGNREFLLTLPAFPLTGLAGLLDHGDPEVRALAAADATLDEPPYALLADSDPRVRHAAAANPLLSAQRIAALLDDSDLAEAAATNPALTAEQLHDLLDRAEVPRIVAA